jgi:hypothetical protein
VAPVAAPAAALLQPGAAGSSELLLDDGLAAFDRDDEDRALIARE